MKRRRASSHVTRVALPLLAGLFLIASVGPPATARTTAATRSPADQLVTDVRAALAGGDLLGVLGAAGIRPVEEHALAAGADPVEKLSAAIDAAGGLVRDVLPDDVRMARMRRESLRSARRGEAPADVLGPAGHRAFDRAAAIVAGAIDAALPRLLAGSHAAPSTDEPVVGCDVVNQPPALCIGGTGDNVITQDYALVIDRGGSDLHGHSAGGAEPFTNGLPVAVTIDLDGNDTYAANLPTPSGAGVAQGAGWLGVGFLVDAAGNDSYRLENDGTWGWAIGQGKGEHGVGVLADLEGNDTYELSTSGGAGQLASGQGQAANGVGILVDRQGDDRHEISATGTEFWIDDVGRTYPPSAVTVGLGMSVMGVFAFATPEPVHADFGLTTRVSYGLFADGGGNDTLELTATVADPDADQHYNQSLVYPPQALAYGVGHGSEGATGLAILEEGATDSSIRAVGRAPLTLTVTEGFGVGYSGSTGVLSDLGGDDVRRLVGDIAIERRATHAEDCVCPPPGVSASIWTHVRGMGYGNLVATGLLEDAAGDDRYLVSATSEVETELRDHRANGNAEPLGSLAQAGAVRAMVQGVGEDTGSGELVDRGGNDRYEVMTGSVARSTASPHGEAPPPGATAITEDVTVVAQGAAILLGQGALTDLGGSDVYTTSSSTTAEANPPTSVQQGTPTAGVLASVDAGSRATFIDRDDGMADQFTASPATAACTGTRGQGHWVDCGGAGVGLMA